jgi:hypothetical protein
VRSQMFTASEDRKGLAMSFVGCKVVYLPNNSATTTTSLLVVGYDEVAKESHVKQIGKPVSHFDLVKLVKKNRSVCVSTIACDDPIFLEYTVEMSSNGTCRKSAVDAANKIKRLAEPEEKNEEDGEDEVPPPRRRRVRPHSNGNACRICFAEDTNLVLFNPCGHATFCVQCAASVSACPICRSPVSGTQRIFFS